jgi:DNA recombination protein RmuC
METGTWLDRVADALGGVPSLSGVEVGLVLLGLVVLACVALQLVLLRRAGRGPDEALVGRLDQLQHGQLRSDQMLREELARGRSELAQQTRHLREEVGGNVRVMSEGVAKQLQDVQASVQEQLTTLRGENEKKLEQMRSTVDEKLQGTLEKRLGEAFSVVSKQLEVVHRGLGEMQALAVGVGDLKKVLTNVKTRGTFGETQLEGLLEQTLAPGQWERQVQVKRGSAERVDFGVRLPGAEGDDGAPVWLPLDAKFPQEDYGRLLEAQERSDPEAAEEAGKALEQSIKQQARRVRDKYIRPPTTTDFAVLFLPTEGLYAEVLRRPGLAETLQRECNVTIAGPTTVHALLNSLQMGFRTLAIQKRSAEVWKVLGAVKSEFGKFGGILDKVQKQLDAATNTIGEASSKTRNIERKLGKVEELPEGEAERLLLPDGP